MRKTKQPKPDVIKKWCGEVEHKLLIDPGKVHREMHGHTGASYGEPIRSITFVRYGKNV